MKKEVEVKVKVNNFSGLLERLAELGCEPGEPVVQEDTVFIDYDRPFIEFTPEDKFLRIRKAGDKTIFTLKQGEELNSVEREFEVSDEEQLKDTLVLLGFRPEVEVRKVRRKAKHGEYEICLDEVEGLGTFIEVEKITMEDPAKVQEEMMEFLRGLGVDSRDRVMNGYDTLVWLKNNPK